MAQAPTVKTHQPVGRLAGLLLATGVVAGCAAVGPDYREPQLDVPGRWQAPLAGGLSTGRPAKLADWWRGLEDPVLDKLVTQAISGNLDLQQARGRVREARARLAVAAADLYPGVQASSAVRRSRSSEEVGGGGTRGVYTAGLDASWELDLFGGTRRAVEAVRADLQASEQDLGDVMVSLLAEVGLNYVQLRSTQGRLGIARENLKAQQESYDIARWRRQAGLTTELDVEQARYSLEQTRAAIPSLETALSEAQNRIAVLLGVTPGSLSRRLSTPGSVPVPPLEVAVGVPAQALGRRPDVRRAERQLAAQTARVGVAEAARYPSLSLLGSIGMESLSSGKLLSASARTASLGASLAWTAFDAGRNRQSVVVQDALLDQALAQYRATVLNALEEVENALTAFVKEQTRRQALLAGTEAAQRAVGLAQDQYSSGLVDFQVVLSAQRTLLSLQDSLAVSDGEVTADLIRLYKALGGGWTPSPALPEG